MAFLTWVFYFALYGFLGWLCETAYCSIAARQFVNRGFVNGPFCPIYAVGALFIVAVLRPFTTNVVLVFAAGLVFTSCLEYFTSWLMETLFHAKWWDYSDKFCNIRGRVCLQNSILFGLLSVAVMYGIHPAAERLVDWLPSWAVAAFSIVFLIYFAADFAVTVRSVLNVNRNLEKLQQIKEELAEKLHTASDRPLPELLEQLKSRAEQNAAEFRLRLQRVSADNHLFERRLIRAFPHLKPHRHAEHLAGLRLALAQKYRRPAQKNKKEER